MATLPNHQPMKLIAQCFECRGQVAPELSQATTRLPVTLFESGPKSTRPLQVTQLFSNGLSHQRIAAEVAHPLTTVVRTKTEFEIG